MKQIKANMFDFITPSITGFIIYHGCNAQGKMSAGFAKQFRETYPKAYNDYLFHLDGFCSPKEALGSVSITNINGLILASAITQEYYGRKAGYVYADIEAICNSLINTIGRHPNMTIHMPRVGCGLGGLSWGTVHDCLIEIENEYNAEFIVWYL